MPPMDDAPKASRRRRALLVTGLAAVGALVGLELFLRARFGLGDPPLYMADAECGYRTVPSRSYRRFGNVFTVNSTSQRGSREPGEKPSGVRRVLCVGDSIDNGGVAMGDAQTLPAVLEGELNKKGKWEVLNASQGGWALGNELGYLREFGTFKADFVVLEVAANDLYQPFSSAEILKNPSYPTKAPPLAIVELFGRYLLPRLGIGVAPPDPGAELKGHQPESLRRNVAILAEEIALVRRQGGVPIVWYVQESPKRRAKNVEPDRAAYAALVARLGKLDVPLFDFTREADANGDALFRDGIHPKPEGNRFFAGRIAPRLWTLAGR